MKVDEILVMLVCLLKTLGRLPLSQSLVQETPLLTTLFGPPDCRIALEKRRDGCTSKCETVMAPVVSIA